MWRSCGASRSATSCTTAWPSPTRLWWRQPAWPTATSPIAACPIRPLIWWMRPPPSCAWRSPPSPSWWKLPRPSCAGWSWPCSRLRRRRWRSGCSCRSSAAAPPRPCRRCSSAGRRSGSGWRSCGSCCSKTKTCATPSPRPSARVTMRKQPGCSTTSSMACSSAAKPWRPN